MQAFYDGALISNHKDGHICDNDTVAVLFEHDPVQDGRLPHGKRVSHLYYGHVQSISWFVNKKERTVHRLHFEEAGASLILQVVSTDPGNRWQPCPY